MSLCLGAVAPSLQQAAVELSQAQQHNKLDHSLKRRADPKQLIETNVMKGG
jgi:hypothetical protein